MQTPILLGHPWLAFDGILAHLINRERRGQDFWTLPSKEPVPQTFLYWGATMPLAQTRNVFHGSVAWLDCNEAHITTIYKRFAEQQCHNIKTEKKAIDIARGHFKAYAMKLPYLSARTATFYARGNIKETLRLLGFLPGLGKKVAYGYGAIKSVSAQETEADYSLIKDGVAMRTLPCHLGFDSDENMVLNYKSPYWNRNEARPCVPPGARVTWTREPVRPF
jgi:hypothetical protein